MPSPNRCQCRKYKKHMGLIPGSRRSPGRGHGNPLQCSRLENPTDRGAWCAVILGATKTRTRLKRLGRRLRWFSRCSQLLQSMDCSPPGSSVHGIPRQEYWSGLPFPSPEDLSDPEIEPASPALAGKFFTDWANSNIDRIISAVWLLRPSLMNGTHSHGSCSSLKQLIVNRIIESCKNMVSSI